MSILVVGSINMDIVNRVAEHPLPGETVKGKKSFYSPGGKGANQAVAASLAGGTVTIMGAIGSDPYGTELLHSLEKYNVNASEIVKKDGLSGMAFITVDDFGENTIILSEGANGLLSIKEINKVLFLLDQTNILILQNEISLETTLFVLREAKKRNVHIYFNPAPALEIPAEVLPLIDFLILNETEMEMVSGVKIDSDERKAIAVNKMLDSGVKAVILTLGEKGSIYAGKGDSFLLTPAYKVTAIDTTAAGDTFIGAFAASKDSGMSTKEALNFAAAASALTVTRQGAQSSIPCKQEVINFLMGR